MPATKTNSLNKLIKTSMEKVGVSKETALSRYLPGPNGGHLHHLAFLRLKKKDRKQLESLIKTHITDTKKPKQLPPLPRAPKGSRTIKGGRTIKLSATELTDILDSLREAGANDLARKLRGQAQTLSQLKRELIDSIRKNSPSDDLWQAFCERAAQLKVRSV